MAVVSKPTPTEQLAEHIARYYPHRHRPSWRERAKPVIAKVLADTAGQPDADIRKALYDAYPFGPRTHHPYKIWLDEIKVQRGQKPPTGTRTAPRKGAPEPDDPSQGTLF